ncbi:hypothetical protein RI129_000281 [Pyrocoelia pectoralis]|uniref:PEHE domain-containing protein n=1 Tax=Pyrocoelia pectoralis TaxID=417401 RepID=A0AAN7ZNS1_9COLE
MQVIKCIESNSDKFGASASDLTSETDSMFPLSTTDLTSNLTSFEKELLNDVDVMNMGIEEQLSDGNSSLKETTAKELLANLQKKQKTLERKLEYTLRRLRKLQTKQIGQHVSEEIVGVFEHVHRTIRRKDIPTSAGNVDFTEKLKPISSISAKNLIKKFEVSTSLQANALGRRHMSRYFGSGSVEPNSLRTGVVGAIMVPQWTPEHKQDLQKVTGHLHAEVHLLQSELDSEATLSSSGGESSDEMQQYTNPHQQYLAIQKRAAWRFAVERAAIAYRWEWLQAQISELEYRIRQYSDLHKQIRLSKGPVVLGGISPPHTPSLSPTVVNGYRGQLPGASPLSTKSLETVNGAVSSGDPTSSRCRPLVGFRKRKVFQTHGLHVVSRKAARSSTIRCGCVPPCSQCGLCTGRMDPTHPRDITDHLGKSERISLLDPSFHPVFSLPEDASTSIHLEAIMKTAEWQHRSTRPNVKSVKFISKGDRSEKPIIPLDHQPKRLPDQRRKYNRLIKSSTINALSNKIKNKLRGRKPNLHSFTRLRRKRHADKLVLPHLQSSTVESSNDEIEQIGNTASNSFKVDSRSSSPLLSTQPIASYKRGSRVSSYDIDNIVIPYSVAASTRVEKLQYKEILTPKWRIIDPEFATKYVIKNNGLVREPDLDSDTEDFSEDAVIVRHEKCEYDEKKKFLSYLKFPYGSGRSRAHKRTDSRAESSGCNSPDPTSPHMGGEAVDNATSPLTSPPATPLSMNVEDSSSSLPSISVLRRRTISRGKDKDSLREDNCSASPEHIEVIPYERRVFPLSEDTYDKMLKLMPENHQFKTNIRAQDYSSPTSFLDEAPDSPNSESTESAFGDEDPNDPEWMDLENARDRYRR